MRAHINLSRPWLVDECDRERAGILLLKDRRDGAFLVRKSEKQQGTYALSLYEQTFGICHYRILVEEGLLCVQGDDRHFETIDDLVAFYKDCDDGLASTLRYPCRVDDDYDLPPRPLPAADPPAAKDRVLSTRELFSSLACHGRTLTSPNISSASLANIRLRSQSVDRIDKTTLHISNRDNDRTGLNLPRAKLRVMSSIPADKTSDKLSQSSLMPNNILQSKAQVDIVAKLRDAVDVADVDHADVDFKAMLKHYIDSGNIARDSQSVHGGAAPNILMALMQEQAENFMNDVLSFSKRAGLLHNIFTQVKAQQKQRQTPNKDQDSVDEGRQTLSLHANGMDFGEGFEEACFEALAEMMGKVQEDVVTCLNVYPKAAVTPHQGRPQSDSKLSGLSPSSTLASKQSVVSFAVKRVSHSLGIEQGKDAHLEVDVDRETLKIDNLKDGGKCVVCEPDEIVQLVKSKSQRNRLGILVAKDNKRRDYLFETHAAREEFVHLIDNFKRDSASMADVKVFVGSWNMGDNEPPKSITAWLTGNTNNYDNSHDIYVLGTQESSGSEKEWVNFIKKHLGDAYTLVKAHSLSAIRICVFVRTSNQSRVSHVETATVSTGVGNILGNKGCSVVAFTYDDRPLLFINAHLTAGAERTLRRRENYFSIIKSLTKTLGSSKEMLSDFDVLFKYDHVFFFGDLNYRLDLAYETIMKMISRKDWVDLRKYDQFLKEQATYNGAFHQFLEGEMNFKPTYRFRKGTRDIYDYIKKSSKGIRINVPSYTDRITWRSAPARELLQENIGAVLDDIMTSDHAPIYSSFVMKKRIKKRADEGGFKDLLPHQCIELKFQAIEISKMPTAKTSQSYTILIQNEFLPKKHVFKSSKVGLANGMLVVEWNANAFTTAMECNVVNRYYMEKSNLYFLVRTEQGENIGQFSVSCRYMFGRYALPFGGDLTLLGEQTGVITGGVCLVDPNDSDYEVPGYVTFGD